MAAYLLIAGTIEDQTRWAEYRDAVVPLIQQFGGRRLRGEGATELLEGVREDWIVAMFEFPSMDSLHAFWRSPEYVPVKALRQGAATLEVWAIPGPARPSG